MFHACSRHSRHHRSTYSVGSEIDGSALLSVRAGERTRPDGARRPVSLLVLRGGGEAARAFSDMATLLAEYPSEAAPRYEGLLEHSGRPVVVTEPLEGCLVSTRLAVPARSARPLATGSACRGVAALAELVARLHARRGGCGLGGVEPGALWLAADGRLLLLPSAACAAPRGRPAGSAPGADHGRHRAPELARGAPVTPRADVYSLGLLLWDLLSLGRAALPDATSAPTSHAAACIDTEVVRLVMTCIAPDPGERPESARALALALRPFAAPAVTRSLSPVSVSPATEPDASLPWATSPVLSVEGGPAAARLVLSAERARWVVGRSEKADLSVPDPEMSRQHFEIVRGEGDAFRVHDLGSKNGLFVGREPADGRVLRAGDVLVAGTTRLRFEPARPARAPSLCSGSGSPRGGSS